MSITPWDRTGERGDFGLIYENPRTGERAEEYYGAHLGPVSDNVVLLSDSEQNQAEGQ